MSLSFFYISVDNLQRLNRFFAKAQDTGAAHGLPHGFFF